VIVKLDAAPVSKYLGDVAGLEATSPEVTGERRVDADSPRARAYEAFLADKEGKFESAMHARLPRARLVHRFRQIIGGVSVVLPADQVKDLYSLPGVQAVYPDVLLSTDTDRSPEFIGAPTLWEQAGGQAHAGEGVIVGIVDTGIWPEHPSVADNGYPPPPAKWHGTTCQFGTTPGNTNDPSFACNNKLIGAARFMATFDAFGGAGGNLFNEFKSARDNNGHGSHTATTAAGNGGVTATTGSTVSGVAPRAHLAAYKVCFTLADGTNRASCYSSDSAAAIEQAIVDGVDVINFSIGGGANPYSDAVSLAFLDAYAAGVFVAAAGGNSGPGADTVDHREPWVTTAAASTTDKGFQGSAALTATGANLTVTGISSTSDLTTASPVVLSATAPGYNNDLCQVPAPAHSLDGKVVACKRGVNARVAKSANVAAGGAVGMILYNVPGGAADLDADVHVVPSVHIDAAQGTTLAAFLAAHAGTTGTITGGAHDLSGQGDVTAAFSSRGGPGQTLGISKPDVAAPGVNILAANTPVLAEATLPQGQLFQIISGTSMASPHVAGAGALLRQLHPDWTPGQIKSALMMTASTENTVKEDGVTPTTPFDVGSGRIDLTVAGKPGLTISETAENYIALAGNLSQSNYPSLYVPVLAGRAVVQRTLKSVDARNRNWKITVEEPSDLDITVPHVVELRKGAQKTITIFVDASGVPVGQTRHAFLHFTSQGDGRDDGDDDHHRHHHGRNHDHDDDIELTFPITVVRKQGDVTLDKTCDPLTLAKGATTTCTVKFANTTFQDETATVFDLVPNELDVKSVTGASRLGNLVFFQGNVKGALPPQVGIQSGSSPAGGYLPLSLFGVPLVSGVGDETITNFNVPAFLFAGQTYTRIGVVSDGYVVVGGGTAADVNFLNQSLPNTAPPNNVLAAFWSDLNPATAPAGGGVRVSTLTDGVTTWIVVDFDRVPNFSSGAARNSFEVWIQVGAVQDITYAYGTVTSGDGNLLTVGAENFLGNRGANYYYNGTGTAVAAGTQLEVTAAPGAPGETKTITISAKGDKVGTWRNCAEMFAPSVFGEATSCVEGEVTKPPKK
jgi:subtilisin family serine protease